MEGLGGGAEWKALPVSEARGQARVDVGRTHGALPHPPPIFPTSPTSPSGPWEQELMLSTSWLLRGRSFFSAVWRSASLFRQSRSPTAASQTSASRGVRGLCAAPDGRTGGGLHAGCARVACELHASCIRWQLFHSLRSIAKRHDQHVIHLRGCWRPPQWGMVGSCMDAGGKTGGGALHRGSAHQAGLSKILIRNRVAV